MRLTKIKYIIYLSLWQVYEYTVFICGRIVMRRGFKFQTSNNGAPLIISMK